VCRRGELRQRTPIRSKVSFKRSIVLRRNVGS
jgi:hypothetical protein